MSKAVAEKRSAPLKPATRHGLGPPAKNQPFLRLTPTSAANVFGRPLRPARRDRGGGARQGLRPQGRDPRPERRVVLRAGGRHLWLPRSEWRREDDDDPDPLDGSRPDGRDRADLPTRCPRRPDGGQAAERRPARRGLLLSDAHATRPSSALRVVPPDPSGRCPTSGQPPP